MGCALLGGGGWGPPPTTRSGDQPTTKDQPTTETPTAWLGLRLSVETLHDLVRFLSYFLLAGVAIVSVTAEQFDPQRYWLAYHVLMYGSLAIAVGLTAATFAWRSLWREAIAICTLVMVLATRGSVVDASPFAPWWSVTAAAAVAVLVAVLSLRCRNQWFAYGSLIPVAFATASTGSVASLGNGPSMAHKRLRTCCRPT